jgi:hypothetical protein
MQQLTDGKDMLESILQVLVLPLWDRFITDWMVRGPVPVGSRLSALGQTSSGAHPTPCKMGTCCKVAGA